MSAPVSKRRKVQGSSSDKPDNAPAITDPRFASIQSDPRYKLPSKRHTHVKLDKRFSRILKDEDFSRKAKVDRYGRPVETDAEKKRFKRRYEIEDDEDDEAGLKEDVEVQKELAKVDGSFDTLREGKYGSSTSEDSSSEEGGEIDNEVEESAAGQQKEEIPMGEVTSRIAVVNLDWDNIRAADLMAVFSSFLPLTGRLLNVAIYPSELGKELMEREEMEGPPREIFTAFPTRGSRSDSDSDSGGDENDEQIRESILKPDDGSEFDSAALRAYQLQRLRYFYAVLTFSSPTSAKHVYDACDGTEYLSTANFFDLRFVPDGTDFSTDTAKEQCEGVPDGYKPNEFVTDALQHSKVRLTWDAEDGGRKEAQARAFGGSREEIDENDLKAYLGSESSDNDDVAPAESHEGAIEIDKQLNPKKEQERQKMRALLGLASEPVKKPKKEQMPVGDLQITFASGLSANPATRGSIFENEPEPQETTVEKYVRRERERKQKRKERAKAARDGLPVEDADSDVEPNAATQEELENEKEADLGFDDPFFAEPSIDTRSANKLRKEERLKKRAEREREEAAGKAERAQLELLMTDDKRRDVRHFNMDEIEKAERRKNKKGKKGKTATAETEMVEAAADSFKVDTEDPRFARLYENHEFAIDPTNPKFRGTEGMRSILEEGRRRRKDSAKGDEKGGPARANKAMKESGRRVNSSDVPDVSTKSLVEKVKRKNR